MSARQKGFGAPGPAHDGAPGPAPRSCGADLGFSEHPRNRRVLLVAYPLLPVSEESAGGAEQVLWTLERELARRDWQTEVAACAGSKVAGSLLVTGEAPRELDGFAEREREHTARVVAACAANDYAIVLDHSGHFFSRVAEHAAQVRMPVLASLHLPRELYAAHAFEYVAENVYFHCVSESQRREFLDLPRMLGVVRNGIDVQRFRLRADQADGGPHLRSVRKCGEQGAPPSPPQHAKGRRAGDPGSPPLLRLRWEGDRLESLAHKKTGNVDQPEAKDDFLLWLGRVCPEKAPHLAIEAAERAGMPIVLAGQVYPFAWHRDYWQRAIAPRIDGDRVHWVELPSHAEKCRLLRAARGLLVTSQIAETTSLVALEAMASGTPVIAFRRGALPEVIGEGTGFLVDDVDQMAAACARLGEIRPEDCRAWVARNYSAAAMADRYEAMMRDLQQLPQSSQRMA